MQKLITQTGSWYLDTINAIRNSAHRIKIVYSIAFFLVVIVQSAYFFFYNNFAITYAILWSLLDWGVWFPMFLTVFYPEKIFHLPERFGLRKTQLFIVITITFPLIHALICYYIYTLFVQVDGGFFVNLKELISRRWFHNMLLSAVFVLVFDYIKKSLQSDSGSRDEPYQVTSQIILKDGVEFHLFHPEEIQWISAAKNYVIIKTVEKQLLIRVTLNDIFEKINEHGFIRISRSVIVNKMLIKEIKKNSRYSHSAILNTGPNFPIGRTYLKSVIKSITS